MMKNCILYKFADDKKREWNVEPVKIAKCNLMECQKEVTGLKKTRSIALNEIAKNEQLELIEETSDNIIFKSSCDFKGRKLLASENAPFVPTSHEIWVRKGNSTVVVFDSGRKLAQVGLSLIGLALNNSPASIEPVKIGKENFLKFKDWIFASGQQGEISRMTLNDIEYDNLFFKQISLSSPQLYESKIFRDLLNASNVIKDMSFKTPPLRSSERIISGRITNRGGITLYTPGLLNTEIKEIINIFEKKLLH
jgi:hypothetical protein